MKKNKGRIFCLLLGLCVIFAGGCNFFGKDQRLAPSLQEEKKENMTTEIIVPSGKEDTATEKEEEKTTQAKPFWQSETSMHFGNLQKVAVAAQRNYRINGPKRGWMSKNGKLYGYYDGYYITPEILVKEGYLETGLDTKGYEILLIRGSDLEQYSGTNVPENSKGFGAFAAVKQNNKYLLASAEGKVGQISQEDYTALLANYNQSHGITGRLSSASAEYGRILNYIGLYEGKFEELFVRQIQKDNKHAVVTFSTTENTADIKQYVLQNDNGFWEVVYPDVQLEPYPITAINQKVPDFNVGLLPNYNLAAWRGMIYPEQGGAHAALFSKGFITSISQIRYQCATAGCAYIVLQNGSRYVAYLDGNYWTAAPVASDYAAKNYFMERTGVDYSFLILDD